MSKFSHFLTMSHGTATALRPATLGEVIQLAHLIIWPQLASSASCPVLPLIHL